MPKKYPIIVNPVTRQPIIPTVGRGLNATNNPKISVPVRAVINPLARKPTS